MPRNFLRIINIFSQIYTKVDLSFYGLNVINLIKVNIVPKKTKQFKKRLFLSENDLAFYINKAKQSKLNQLNVYNNSSLKTVFRKIKNMFNLITK